MKEARSKIEPGRKYELEEAIELLKSFRPARFDETVELAVKLGIDVKKADQMVRGTLRLPHGIGKTVRVIAFAAGADAEKAKAAGAIEAGEDELINKINEGWLDFDVAVAHKSMMPKVSKLGRTLGPKGLMPSPKSGTVTENIEDAVKDFVAGKIEYRADDTGIVHVVIGKLSFGQKELVDNAAAFLEHIRASRPATVKGVFVQKVSVSSTMSPGIALSTA
jgi:large subunit ribosomal protein L1